jgi:hypothetical protein
MTHWSLTNVLFSFQLLACFLLLFLLLTLSFNALWSDRMHVIISIFLYLLRLPLGPRTWSIFEKVAWTAEKNFYCVEVGWNVLWTSTRYICSMVCLRSRISLLIFCLDDLSIGDGGIKVSHYHCVAFRSFRICLKKLGALKLGAYRLIIVISFWCSSPFINMKCPLSHCSV